MHSLQFLIAALALCLVGHESTVRADVSSVLHSLLFKYADDDSEIAGLTATDNTLDVFKANRAGLPLCTDHHLMVRLAQRQITSPERVLQMFVDSGGDLVDLCREMKSDIMTTTTELKKCGPFKDDNLYWLLFKGLGEMYRQLCTVNNELTARNMIEINGNQKCVRYLKEEYVDCEGPADWFEKPDPLVNCQIFEDVVNCYYIKTAELCGLELATLMRIFSVDVINNSLMHQCNMPRGKPKVKSPMPSLNVQKNEASKNNPNMYLYSYILSTLYLVFYVLR